MPNAMPVLAAALMLASACTMALTSCMDVPAGEPLSFEPVFDAEPVDHMGGRPFVISPDGLHLAFSLSGDDPSLDASAPAIGVRELEAVRILDLPGAPPRAPAVGPTARRLVDDGHAPVPTLRCWGQEGAILYMPTTARRWFELDVRQSELAWRSASNGGPPSGCLDRAPIRPPLLIGDFEVTATSGGGLRVEHLPERRVVWESNAPLIRRHRLRGVALSPEGRRLIVLYSLALGSFSGPQRSVLVTDGASRRGGEVRVLQPALLFAAWHPDGGEVFGYGPVAGRRHHGIFRARVGS
jgi:hypothetical protein